MTSSDDLTPSLHHIISCDEVSLSNLALEDAGVHEQPQDCITAPGVSRRMSVKAAAGVASGNGGGSSSSEGGGIADDVTKDRDDVTKDRGEAEAVSLAPKEAVPHASPFLLVCKAAREGRVEADIEGVGVGGRRTGEEWGGGQDCCAQQPHCDKPAGAPRRKRSMSDTELTKLVTFQNQAAEMAELVSISLKCQKRLNKCPKRPNKFPKRPNMTFENVAKGGESGGLVGAPEARGGGECERAAGRDAEGYGAGCAASSKS
jgi:hypothetical protein